MSYLDFHLIFEHFELFTCQVLGLNYLFMVNRQIKPGNYVVFLCSSIFYLTKASENDIINVHILCDF